MRSPLKKGLIQFIFNKNNMSRIGKAPVELSDKIEVTLSANNIKVK